MRYARRIKCLILWTALAIPSSAACIPMTEAAKHIGDTACIQAKVLTVSEGLHGTTYLNFCEDHRLCPFTVVVFSSDLRHVGDVRRLAGKQIEIHGQIHEYDNNPEIILREARQLRGESAKLPPVPKQYDVERRSKYSAGKFSHPTSSGKPKKTRTQPGYKTYDPGTADE
jgi:DNA/RNA endonuclease YhcR with UshA esterase domain